MAEINKLQEAMRLMLAGNRKQASSLFGEVYAHTSDQRIKMESIKGLTDTLDPALENEKIIEVSEVGISLASSQKKPQFIAYFTGKKADTLTFKATLLSHKRMQLKMAPNWLAFALESEQKKFDELSVEIDSLSREAEVLFARAIQEAKTSGDLYITARILMERGGSTGTRYLRYKTEIMDRANAKMFLFLHKFGLGDYAFDRATRKEFKKYIDAIRADFLEAIQLLNELGDESEKSYAFYNLANQLRTANKFHEAKKYLTQAKPLARKYNQTLLLKNIEEAKGRIKSKNQNIPDYSEVLGG